MSFLSDDFLMGLELKNGFSNTKKGPLGDRNTPPGALIKGIFPNFFCSNPSLDQETKSQPKKHNIVFTFFGLAVDNMVGGAPRAPPLHY